MHKTKSDSLDNLKFKSLTATELEYMNLIWSHPEGISTNEISTFFPQHAAETKRVILHKITKKGFVERIREGRHQKYYFKISKGDYNDALNKSLFTKKFKLPFDNIVAAFCGKDKLSDDQLNKLHQLIEELKNDPDK